MAKKYLIITEHRFRTLDLKPTIPFLHILEHWIQGRRHRESFALGDLSLAQILPPLLSCLFLNCESNVIQCHLGPTWKAPLLNVHEGFENMKQT